jgi:exodeoxyribonuclease X
MWDLNVETRALSYAGGGLHLIRSSPPETRAIHGITVRDTLGTDPFDGTAVVELAQAEGVWGFAAHSAEHEVKWIGGAMAWICTYKSALRIWPEAPSFSNQGLRCWLEDEGLLILNRELAGPTHRASPDAYVTAHILLALLAAGATGSDMLQWTKEPALLPRCPLGQWRGHAWPEVDSGFLHWILRTIFDRPDVRFCAQNELDRRYPPNE